MRYLFVIFFLSYFHFSFSQKPEKKDAFKFTYLYSDALKFKMEDNYEEALKLFEECLKYKPESSATFYQLSLIYFRKMEYENAMSYINQALDIVPDNEWYLLQKAECASRLDDDKAFVAAYHDLYRYYPQNPEYAYKLAVIDYKQQNYDNALLILNTIEKEQGVVENISFLKNNIFYQTKRYDLLLLELKKLVAVFPDSVKYVDMLAKYYLSMHQPNKAMDVYQQGLLKFPDSKRLSIGLAQLYGNMKNFREGYPFLIKGIGTLDISIKELSKIAENYLNSHEISKEQKIIIYKQLIDNYPDEMAFQTEFINYLLHEKQFDLAEINIIEILKSHSENFDLWAALLNIYSSQKRYELLLESANEALEYFPNQALLYFYSGYAYFYLKDYQKAISTLETGLDYVLDNKDIQLQFYLYLAEAYHAVMQTNISDEYFEKYLALNRHNPYVMNNYAYYLTQNSRNLEKALYFAERSIEIEPFNPSFLDTYAWVLYLKNSFKDALFNIEKAYKYGGDKNALICEHYAYILLKNHEIDKAKNIIQQSLKLNPDNVNLKKLLQTLDAE